MSRRRAIDVIGTALRRLWAVGPFSRHLLSGALRSVGDEIPIVRDGKLQSSTRNGVAGQLSTDPDGTDGGANYNGGILGVLRDTGDASLTPRFAVLAPPGTSGQVLTAAPVDYEGSVGVELVPTWTTPTAVAASSRSPLNAYGLWFGGNCSTDLQYLEFNADAATALTTTGNLNDTRMAVPIASALFRVCINSNGSSGRLEIHKNGVNVRDINYHSPISGAARNDSRFVVDFPAIDFAEGDRLEVRFRGGTVMGNTRVLLLFGPHSTTPTQIMGHVMMFGVNSGGTVGDRFVACGNESTPTNGAADATKSWHLAMVPGTVTKIAYSSNAAKGNQILGDIATTAWTTSIGVGVNTVSIAVDALDRVKCHVNESGGQRTAAVVYMTLTDPLNRGLLVPFGGDPASALAADVGYNVSEPADNAMISASNAGQAQQTMPGVRGIQLSDKDGGYVVKIGCVTEGGVGTTVTVQCGKQAKVVTIAEQNKATVGLVADPGDLLIVCPQSDANDTHLVALVQ